MIGGRREKEKKAEDAKLQITAEMLEARGLAKRRKLARARNHKRWRRQAMLMVVAVPMEQLTPSSPSK